MTTPKAIIILYPDASGIDRISKPSNYSLSRIILERSRLGCPVYFFNHSKNKEQLDNVFFIPLSFWNLFTVILHLGFSRKVLVISQTSKYDRLAIWLKKILNYKVLIRRGG